MSNGNQTYCGCSNPNGFKFIEYESGSQIWLHVACNGLVVRPLIKSEKK